MSPYTSKTGSFLFTLIFKDRGGIACALEDVGIGPESPQTPVSPPAGVSVRRLTRPSVTYRPPRMRRTRQMEKFTQTLPPEQVQSAALGTGISPYDFAGSHWPDTLSERLSNCLLLYHEHRKASLMQHMRVCQLWEGPQKAV